MTERLNALPLKDLMMSIARLRPTMLLLGCVLLSPGLRAADTPTGAYQYSTEGVACIGPGSEGCRISVLLDRSNFGGDELEMAEVEFAAGHQSQAHPHQSIEIFYVLSGQFGHEVNGVSAVLEPGMVGVVRPGDQVRHYVPDEAPARVLVIWVPGGELARSGIKYESSID